MACDINKLQVDVISLLGNLRPSDEKTVLEIVQSVLGNDYTIPMALGEFTGAYLSRLNKILYNIGYNRGEVKNTKQPVADRQVSNIYTIFNSPSVSDLFDTLHVAEGYFERQVKELLMVASRFNYEGAKTYVDSPVTLNNNIKRLKNELFEKIVIYLDNNGKLQDREKFFTEDGTFIGKLYINGKFANYDLYKDAIQALQQLLLGSNEENALISNTGRKIPIVKGDIGKASDRMKFDVYNAAIFLVNFDNVVSKFASNNLSLNLSTFNDFNDPTSGEKYSLKSKGEETPYWLQDNHAAEAAENNEDELTRSIINSIKYINENDEETGMYLDMKDFYSVASFLREFERTHFLELSRLQQEGKEGYADWKLFNEDSAAMLDWYMDKIIAGYAVQFTGDYEKFNDFFKYRVGIMKSLKKFVNSIREKEKTSKLSVVNILTQPLNNSFGANYSIDNIGKHEMVSQEMHSHNADRVAVQTGIYYHLLSNTQTLDNFWIGIKPVVGFNEKLTNTSEEVENINKQVDTDYKLSSFVYKTLGFYIGEQGAAKLRARWGQYLGRNIQFYLNDIRTSKTKDDKSAFDKIIENEKLIEDNSFDDVVSRSEVISDVNSKIQDVISIYLENFVLRPIMTLSTFTGESIPTYKLANLMYNDTAVLRSRQLLEQLHEKDRRYKNLFLKDGGLLGTSTKLELIHKDTSKDAFKLNVLENFTSNFEFDFLDGFRRDSKAKGINVMIGNYSDKNTILKKIIDVNVQHKIGEKPKYIIGNKDGKDVMSIEDLKDLVRSQSENYYKDLFDNIFGQYKKLGVAIGDDFDTNVTKIHEYLWKFDDKEAFLQDVVNKSLKDPDVRIVEELHYSTYRDGVLALNQVLIDYYRIFSNKEKFNEFVKLQEGSLAKKLEKEKGKNQLFSEEDLITLQMSDKKKGDSPDPKIVKDLLSSFGIVQNDYKSFETHYKGAVTGHKISLTTGKLNPLLERWMWTNNLFRNEYLFISVKPEYMHPHKDKLLEFRGSDPTVKFEELSRELNGRLPNMSKRNASMPATFELPIRNSRLGVSENVNVAVLEDLQSQLHNLSGQVKENQEIHDGSSMITYLYSRMVENSYPGKGYEGTKKQVGTFVTEFGSAFKKDAETVITNNKIRDSYKAPVNLHNIQKKALSAIPFPAIENFEKNNITTNNIFYSKREYIKINSYKIAFGSLTMNTSKYDRATNKWMPQGNTFPLKVKNLYDIWNSFGGEFSVNSNFEFSEGSNELLYDLITTYNVKGKYILKDNFIHIISNHSAFKSGATNLNPSTAWTNSNKLAFTTFENRHMGPQLDANHKADASKIKEITQLISALSQNPTTAHLAEEVYNDIATIIRKSAEPYLSKTRDLDPEKLAKLYKMLSRNFAYSLATNTNVGLAKAIVETFDKGAILPFSNQNLFREFTRDMVTRMNDEFITRYYPGLGAVLNPSHGIIQLFESPDGRIYKQEDIIKEAFNWYNKLDIKMLDSNQAIIDAYIINKFPDKEVSIDLIQPGDTIVNFGTLDTIEKYYEAKELYKGQNVLKSYSTPRDLKPEETTFIANGQNKNLYDIDSVRLRYVFEQVSKGKTASPKDSIILTNFINHFIVKGILKQDSPTYTKDVFKLLNAWTQRNLQLLDSKKVMREMTETEDLDLYFGEDTLIKTQFKDIQDHYLTKNSVEVANYKHSPAELILPNNYKGIFDTGTDTINDIYDTVDDSGRNIYFEKKIAPQYVEDDFRADLKINLKDGNKPIYIVYVNTLPYEKEDGNLFNTVYNKVTGESEVMRLDVTGKPIYIKPDNSLIISKNGVDKIYIKVGTSKDQLVTTGDAQEKITKTVIFPGFESSLKSFIRSFNGEIASIVPLMSNSNDKLANDTVDSNWNPKNLNQISFNIFKRFSDFTSTGDNQLDRDWLQRNKISVIQQLSNKMFASWEKSHEFVSSRIPAQSMQSFMEMKRVGYFNTESNDAYVSVFQIWYQGSDFDIDKAYIMGYGFDKNGHYDTWSPISDYTNKAELDALEKLPIPSGKSVEWVDNGLDVTKDFQTFAAYAMTNPDKVDLDNLHLSAEVITAFGNVLHALKTNPQITLNTEFTDTQILFTKILDKHNLSIDYLNRRSSVKNSIVSKIRTIISAPSNRLLASEPVNVKQLHDGAKAAKAKLGFEEDILSPWDMLSTYEQQNSAAVGKQDVGIGANGLKVLFALNNYYNSWYSKIRTGEIDRSKVDFINDPKSFKKIFTINGKTRYIHTVANIDISNEILQGILDTYKYKQFDKDLSELSEEQAALIASGFVSGATDNAKELVMAKINAVIELAGMHLYLISLGYNMEDIAIYMNSNLARYVAKNISGNIFKLNKTGKKVEKTYVDALVDKYGADHEDDLGIDQETAQFKDIYYGAQEFKALSSMLSANQGVSANINELNSFLTQLESTMYAREHFTLNKTLKSLRQEETWDIAQESLGQSTIDTIIEKNDLLRLDPIGSRQYVKDVLRRASSIKVNYTDEDGITQSKKVSLVGGQFDFRYYMTDSNTDYRNVAIEYYNLFKNTINVFDVVDKSPHFKAMIDGMSIIHNILGIASKKYNFAFNKMRDLTRAHSDLLITNNSDIIKTQFGNPAFPVKVDDLMLSRFFSTFDRFAVSNWLKSRGQISRFRFSAQKLMQLAGVSNMTFYKTDEVKFWSVGDIKTAHKSMELTKHLTNINKDKGEDFVIDLTTDYGIANFKMLMEDVVLKILQKSQTSSLSRSLKLTSVKNPLGHYTSQIASTFNISSLNSPVSMEKFQELLSSFNEVDVRIEPRNKISNAENINVPYKDLLYVYNLIVNNESYGDKRLTPLFEDYIKHKDTVANEYLRHSTKIDTGITDIFELSNVDTSVEGINLQNKLAKDQIEDLLYLAYHKRGTLYLSKAAQRVTVRNSNFPINTTIDMGSKQNSIPYTLIRSAQSIIANKNLIINLKCD